jgi:6-pyruvoyltetrahydropterin/6-carboxytetrahydropterin synthase
MTIEITRTHDISCGHRVFGHEGACANLHGHNYRIHFTCAADDLDDVGRVIDFSVIRDSLCAWLDDHWDHRMLMWADDPLCVLLQDIDSTVAKVPFNPTAENIAIYLVEHVGPNVLRGTGVQLVEVRVEETRKCSATACL